MKPMGISYFKLPSKTDFCSHSLRKQGYVNWWENVVTPNKKKDRQKSKKSIEKSKMEYITKE